VINPKAALVSAGFIVLMIAAGLFALGQVPADTRIATHFAADGTPNGWMSPFPAFFIAPAIAVLMWLLLLAIPRFGRRAIALTHMPRTYGVLWAVPVLIAAPVHLVVAGPALGLSWATLRLVPASIGVLFILLGNVMGKLPPNPFIGIRTPWTRADDRVWDQTHRFGGWVFVAGGFVILGSALLVPSDKVFPPVVLVVVVSTAALCTVKSWLLSRERRNGG
jgi:uncharacterized membrane protein